MFADMAEEGAFEAPSDVPLTILLYSFYYLRAENRLSDWLFIIPALSSDRYGDRLGLDVAGDDDVEPNAGLAAV